MKFLKVANGISIARHKHGDSQSRNGVGILFACFAILSGCLFASGCNTQPATDGPADASTSNEPAVAPIRNADAAESTILSEKTTPEEEPTVIDIDKLLTPEEIASVVGHDQIARVAKYKGSDKMPSRGFIAEPKERLPSDLIYIVHIDFADVVSMNTTRYRDKADTFTELDDLGDGGFASETRKKRQDREFTEFILMFRQAGHAITFTFEKHDSYTGPQTIQEMEQLIKIGRIVSANLAKAG